MNARRKREEDRKNSSPQYWSPEGRDQMAGLLKRGIEMAKAKQLRVKRVYPGVYEVLSKGRTFEVCRTVHPNGETWWYWREPPDSAHDLYATKHETIAALQAWLEDGEEGP